VFGGYNPQGWYPDRCTHSRCVKLPVCVRFHTAVTLPCFQDWQNQKFSLTSARRIGLGEDRDAIAAFLFTWPDGDTAKPAIKLPKVHASPSMHLQGCRQR
jgi:hypothetical protein